jgi:hypothetical protein
LKEGGEILMKEIILFSAEEFIKTTDGMCGIICAG